MNGYKFTLYQAVYHNGKFSHNLMKDKIVHAKTQPGAHAQVKAELEPQTETILESDMVILCGPQYIKSGRLLGTVRYRIVVEYDPN